MPLHVPRILRSVPDAGAVSVALPATSDCAAAGGHVLINCDARNPEIAGNGAARRQYEAALAACRAPGLFRRLSWQKLMRALAGGPQFTCLVDGLEGKYGIRPG